MPIDYVVDADRDLMLCVASGALTNRSIVVWLRRLIDDPVYRTGMNALVDARQVEDLVVNAEAVDDVVDLATKMEHRFSGSHWAMIADRDGLFGLARMYELRREAGSYDLKAFREAGEAYVWLGLPEDYDPPTNQTLLR